MTALRLASTTAQLGINGNISPDIRNNLFTGLTLAGVVQTLPNFPYTMPGDAATLQTDMQAAGWAGATVTASSSTIWEILVPNVSLTAYGQANKIAWPIYQNGTDMFGKPTYSSGADFYGACVDSSGTIIKGKAFGRLKITAGSRYDPYL